MVKIIISGTYDGFYPRYATDGILDDDICKKLLDRRMYFSKAGDSLFKEGYSFQCIKDAGIFYHKIILLFDALGRDGFMMASLFLPIGEKLDGKEIKDALDSIIRDYKNRTSNGIATIDLDWSFVKRKADELVQKVKTAKWEKRPVNNSSATALISGVDNRVADYFDYPNPLHRLLSGYEQIFLTESLLDPSMISENGEQGYKVLKKEIVDIDNPEYTIVYNRELLQGENLSCVKKLIKKDELESHHGDIPLGTLSRTGYRSAIVSITNKVSKDGSTIIVSLPDLRQKEASVELKIIDHSDRKIIPSYNCNIEWSNEVFGKPKVDSSTGKYIFYGEGCDKEWHLSIKNDAYQDYEEVVYVSDGNVKSKEIQLIPKPKWNVFIQRPDGTMRPFSQGILADDLDYQINTAENYLKDQGLDVDPIIRDEESRIVTVVSKRKPIPDIIINDTVISSQKNQTKVADTGEIVCQSGPNNNGLSGKNNEFDNSQIDIFPTSDTVSHSEKQMKTYYLHLDTESRSFSLFKNCSKKQHLAENISKNIQLLESFKNSGSKVFKEKIGAIISFLRENNSDNAERTLSELLESDKRRQLPKSVNGRKIIDSINSAIKSIEKYRSIVDVVEAPNDVKYNPAEHRLECERLDYPEEQVVLAKDKYEYDILAPSWTLEKRSSQKCMVKRKLSVKYKVLGIVVPIAVIFAIILIICNFMGNGETDEKYQSYKKEIAVLLNEYNRLSFNVLTNSNSHYIGDSVFYKLDSLKQQVTEFIESNEEYKDSLYIDDLNSIYNIQAGLKCVDESIYDECIKMLESDNAIDLSRWHNLLSNPVLSKVHFEELNRRHKQKVDSDDIESVENSNNIIEDARKTLYQLCLSDNGTVYNIANYFNTYGSDNVLGRKLIEFASRNSLDKTARIKACDLYIYYYPRGRKIDEIRSIKNSLEGKVEQHRKEQEKEKDNTSGPKTEEGKTEIKKATGILKYLGWNYVKDNGKVFHEKCDVKNDNIRKEIEKIIANAQSQTEANYSKAINSAKSDTHQTTDIIKLEHFLGMHGSSCKQVFGNH